MSEKTGALCSLSILIWLDRHLLVKLNDYNKYSMTFVFFPNTNVLD